MANPLADFLEKLLSAGQLVRVGVEVDPHLEAAELTRRIAAERGPALLLDRLSGQKTPLVTNLLGTPARLCLALGIDRLDELAARLDTLTQNAAQNWLQRLRATSEPPASERFQPRVVKSGSCQQVVRLGRDVQLGELPALKAWPGESFPTLSAVQAISTNPGSKVRSVSLCRLHVVGEQRLAIIDDGATGLARDAAEAQRLGERLPVALVLGGDPTALLAAAIPLRLDVDGLLLCGLLRDKPLELVKARSQPLEVPADADLIIEGFIEPEPMQAPPATGVVSTLRNAPVVATPDALVAAGLTNSYYRREQSALNVQVTAITQRTNPILPAIVYGLPDGELATLQLAIERMLFPIVRAAIPELVDCALPCIGGLHSFAVLSIEKSSAYEARKVASAAWGLDLTSLTKVVVIVDAEVDVHDARQVLAEIGANVHPARDIFFHQGPGDPCDHAAPTVGLGEAVGIDATRKLAGEHPADWPARLATDADIAQRVAQRWSEYGITQGREPR